MWIKDLIRTHGFVGVVVPAAVPVFVIIIPTLVEGLGLWPQLWLWLGCGNICNLFVFAPAQPCLSTGVCLCLLGHLIGVYTAPGCLPSISVFTSPYVFTDQMGTKWGICLKIRAIDYFSFKYCFLVQFLLNHSIREVLLQNLHNIVAIYCETLFKNVSYEIFIFLQCLFA